MVELPYPITVAESAFDRLDDVVQSVAARANRIAVITDSEVGPRYADRVRKQLGAKVDVFTIPSGEQHKTRDTWSRLTDIIARSVEIKAAIVARDERESGLRKVLNFGHTIGHAIEAASEFETLHGEAVAIGLVAEARLAERIGVAKTGTARVIERVCRAAGLQTTMPSIPVDTI